MVTVSLLLAACSPATGQTHLAANIEQGTVTRVVDADTVHVRTAHGVGDVRVLGIDSPETVKPNTPVQCGGPEASAFAHRELDGQTITLVADATQDDQDRYGRSLRYLRLPGGRDFSLDAMSAGWARVYTYHGRPVQEYPQLEAVQRASVAAHRGIWGTCPNPAPGG